MINCQEKKLDYSTRYSLIDRNSSYFNTAQGLRQRSWEKNPIDTSNSVDAIVVEWYVNQRSHKCYLSVIYFYFVSDNYDFLFSFKTETKSNMTSLFD